MKIVEGQDHSKIGVQSQDYFKIISELVISISSFNNALPKITNNCYDVVLFIFEQHFFFDEFSKKKFKEYLIKFS